MDAARERLRFLLDTVALEAEHLQGTDRRLFAEPFTPERAARLRDDSLLPACRTRRATSCCPPCWPAWANR